MLGDPPHSDASPASLPDETHHSAPVKTHRNEYRVRFWVSLSVGHPVVSLSVGHPVLMQTRYSYTETCFGVHYKTNIRRIKRPKNLQAHHIAAYILAKDIKSLILKTHVPNEGEFQNTSNFRRIHSTSIYIAESFLPLGIP